METYPGGDPVLGRSIATGDGHHGEEPKEKAKRLSQTASGRAMAELDNRKGEVSGLLDKVAQNVGDDRIGGYVADCARRGAEYLRNHSAQEMLGSIRSGLTSRPATLVGASFLVGFAAARLFKR
jgi:hypothetical protein